MPPVHRLAQCAASSSPFPLTHLTSPSFHVLARVALPHPRLPLPHDALPHSLGVRHLLTCSISYPTLTAQWPPWVCFGPEVPLRPISPYLVSPSQQSHCWSTPHFALYNYSHVVCNEDGQRSGEHHFARSPLPPPLTKM